MQRKDEILAKKAKLAELRRQREEREQRQKDSGKRESIAGELPEVPCPCYNQYARLLLTYRRLKSPLLLEQPTERSSTASLTLSLGTNVETEVLGRPLQHTGKAVQVPHSILGTLVPRLMTIHQVNRVLKSRTSQPAPKPYPPLPSKPPTSNRPPLLRKLQPRF